MNSNGNENTFRDDKANSIIKVGDTFFDIKTCFAFSFEDDPEGFLFMKARSVYDVSKSLLIPIPDSNALHRTFLQLEYFLNPQLTTSLKQLVDEILSIKNQAFYEKCKQPAVKKTTKKKKDS